MAHAQKPDFVFRRNGRVRLNRRGPQFSRLLAAEVSASAVMPDTPCSEIVWRVLATHSNRQFPLNFPLPCVTVCHHISIGLYNISQARKKTSQWSMALRISIEYHTEGAMPGITLNHAVHLLQIKIHCIHHSNATDIHCTEFKVVFTKGCQCHIHPVHNIPCHPY